VLCRPAWLDQPQAEFNRHANTEIADLLDGYPRQLPRATPRPAPTRRSATSPRRPRRPSSASSPDRARPRMRSSCAPSRVPARQAQSRSGGPSKCPPFSSATTTTVSTLRPCQLTSFMAAVAEPSPLASTSSSTSAEPRPAPPSSMPQDNADPPSHRHPRTGGPPGVIAAIIDQIREATAQHPGSSYRRGRPRARRTPDRAHPQRTHHSRLQQHPARPAPPRRAAAARPGP
jgi:hypothetical protein